MLFRSDSQIGRIDRLLNDSVFDERWKHRLDEETKVLDALDHTGDARDQTHARVLGALNKRIESTADFDEAYALLQYADAQAQGRFELGHATLEKREAARLRALTRTAGDRVDRAWADRVETELNRFARAFPRGVEKAELELELGEAYLGEIGRASCRERV